MLKIVSDGYINTEPSARMGEVWKVVNTQYVIVLSSAEPQYLFANSDQTMVVSILNKRDDL